MNPIQPQTKRAPDDLPIDLAGIDQRIGRASTDGNEKLYRRLLEMFRTGQHDVVERFRAARAYGDDLAAMRLAHNLQTVAASLGMVTLAEVGKRLEWACREVDNDANDAQLQRLLDELAHALGPVLAGLNALHAANAANESNA